MYAAQLAGKYGDANDDAAVETYKSLTHQHHATSETADKI